ncbi:MAG: DUF2207 domain-containing protein [Patescibacteria group bacterium]|nr:DUF2207 domain-containing protein [Patescibacteria group bacterium]
MQKTIIHIFILILLLIFPKNTLAQSNSDWYLQDFQSEIIVNTDSSLTITEKITADADNLTGKHGIYRVLPTRYKKTSTEYVNTPIKLISITDFSDNPLKYQEKKDFYNHTISWQIGDVKKEVQGVNYYKIKYTVQNVIRFDNSNFDEFYWNLNGNFWQIKTDKFTANIIFPSNINSSNSSISYYTGQLGQTSQDLAKYSWISPSTLKFVSTTTLQPQEGITASVTFPKNIFTPYKPSFWEKYSQMSYFLIPFIILIISFLLWKKFGRDPKLNRTIVPEFSIPNNLSPLEMGVVISDGSLKNSYISAQIIYLAVNKIIKIEQINKKSFFGHNDYKLILLSNKKTSSQDKLLINALFSGKKEILLSNLRNVFYSNIPQISQSINNELTRQRLIEPRSKIFQIIFLILAFVSLALIFVMFALSPYAGFSAFLSSIIFLIFSYLLKQRTKKGTELMLKINGFKLYMETAEKYRQKFNEKEGIFEKFLPYAMIFGITRLWIEKIKAIYGEDYFTRYYPYWFVGYSFGHFDVDSINQTINSLSNSMNSAISSNPSGSGAGGGGFSGGGGGGGGGGGW